MGAGIDTVSRRDGLSAGYSSVKGEIRTIRNGSLSMP